MSNATLIGSVPVRGLDPGRTSASERRIVHGLLSSIKSADQFEATGENEDAIVSALRARLAFIESEITRLTNFACEEQDPERQEERWKLAVDLQREARAVRDQLRVHSRPKTTSSISAKLRRLLHLN